jgi:hypothetical protein
MHSKLYSRHSELKLSRELQLARLQLIGDTGERRFKAHTWSGVVSVGLTEADDIAMIQHIGSLDA